jgi:hypothetical protein
MEEKRGGSEELGKIDEELTAMTSVLNTGDFMMPFRYPIDLLVKAKHHLVEEYF